MSQRSNCSQLREPYGLNPKVMAGVPTMRAADHNSVSMHIQIRTSMHDPSHPRITDVGISSSALVGIDDVLCRSAEVTYREWSSFAITRPPPRRRAGCTGAFSMGFDCLQIDRRIRLGRLSETLRGSF
jgi:hypothetical protein